MTITQKFKLAILFIVIGLAAASCDQKTNDTAEYVWDLSLPWSSKVFHSQNAMKFAKRVKEETNGRLVINVHVGAVLGIKGAESMRAVGEGIVDMADLPGFQQVGLEPILGLESLPFLVSNHNELALLYNHLRPAVADALARHNIIPMYITPWPNQNIYTKHTISTLSELAGKKIRTYDKTSSELMERLGMAAMQIPSPDVVPALASGALDATMTSTTTGAAQKYWEFVSHIYRTNHMWISNIMAVNKDSWDKLPADLKKIVNAVAKDMEPDFWHISKADDLDKLQVLKANGITVVTPSQTLINEMRDAANPMWVDFRRDIQGADLIISKYLKDKADGKADSYPFPDQEQQQ